MGVENETRKFQMGVLRKNNMSVTKIRGTQ